MTNEQEDKQEFTVTDKRLFQEDGEPRAEETSDKCEKSFQPEPSTETFARAQDAPERPPIDFPSYILSYYTQGLVLLGEVPNPYTNKKEEDVEAARHMIDILSMLEEKTKGNLANEEKQLLESVLYELRIKFMAKTNRIKL
jgi:hypothetical protein